MTKSHHFEKNIGEGLVLPEYVFSDNKIEQENEQENAQENAQELDKLILLC